MASLTHAAEPAYCNKKVFLSKKVEYDDATLKRNEIFQLGRVKLAGLGVGSSDASSVSKMAETVAQVPSSDNFCSWYFNKGNEEAEKLFTHIYMNDPRSLNIDKAVKEYAQKLSATIADAPVSIMYCMEKFGYVALGCNGMKHRGPTVFGMILAYSGCSPEKAADIVNSVWGLNGVPAQTRLAIIKGAHQLGQENLEESNKMRTLFEQQ